MKVATTVLGIIIGSYGFVVGSTLWWTITGHCCGLYVPYFDSDPARCLPAADKMWWVWKGNTICDPNTWKRVTKP